MALSRYFISYSVPLSAALGIFLGETWVFITPIYIFLFVPILEYLIGENKYNLSPEEETKVKASKMYSILLWSFVPIQYCLTGYLILEFWSGSLAGIEILGAVLSVGISNGGTGITVAHELVHRSNNFERFLGRILLLTTLYMHFAIEHVYGHHKHVATPEDPATANKGENFYLYWIRTVPEQFVSAWNIEKKRMSKKNRSFFSFRNEMLQFILIQFGLILLLGILFSPLTALIFVLTAVVSFSLLEAVNYLEHYGLERRLSVTGKYEKVNHHHSWNSDFSLSRMLLFELSRHSDHHATASRKYQVLRTFDDSPQLPTGYPGMIVIALFPPIWFKIMDPLVEKATVIKS